MSADLSSDDTRPPTAQDLLLAKVEPSAAEVSHPSTVGLPLSVLRQSARRLEVVSLLLTGVLVVAWLGVNLYEGELGLEFQSPAQWIPSAGMLIVSLIVLVLARRWRRSPSSIVLLGLIYEVVISAFQPLSQYYHALSNVDPRMLNSDMVGLSPVALWMLLITVLVPARPRHALVALMLSGASVPVTMLALIRVGDAPAIPADTFLLIFVLPYAFAVVAAYVAARVIYGLGRDVSRAQELGSYRLLSLIGRGGMGEVWQARHNMLARPAAIKVIRRDALGRSSTEQYEALSRFEREAQATAELRSPHTVELYDFGVSDDGSLYYVMELIEGIDLESLVHRFGPLPVERVVHILRQTCLSLSEAHEHNLVHRDIKPANILLCQRGFGHDFVKVLDFGLVKRLSSFESTDETPMTQANTLQGTPAYVAPEVALGKTDIDGRADLYSLGCVAFWLLTGHKVFEDESAMGTIAAHINTIAKPPSAIAESSIPAELDALVLACLAKNPGDRPATARDLALSLDGLDKDSEWSLERCAEWWRMYVPGR